MAMGKQYQVRRVGFIIIVLLLLLPEAGYATPLEGFNLEGDQTQTLNVLFLFSIITLLPSILIMMTSFTRIIIVLSFLRNALGLQQTPPNQVLIGVALFLSFFIMSPVMTTIYEEAYVPYNAGAITGAQAIANAQVPIKEFMLKQTKPEDLKMFVSMSPKDEPEIVEDLGLEVIVPAFMTSELKQAFIMGFMLFIPFIIIDMVVASILMSMGMIMLPPVMISLPFKLLLFVLIDGWSLLIETLVTGFR